MQINNHGMFDPNHYMYRGGGGGGGGKEFIYRIISANKLCTRTVGEEGWGGRKCVCMRCSDVA